MRKFPEHFRCPQSLQPPLTTGVKSWLHSLHSEGPLEATVFWGQGAVFLPRPGHGPGTSRKLSL